MKKSLIGTLGLGLVLGAIGMNVYANDSAPIEDQIYRSNSNAAVVTTGNQGYSEGNIQFETLDQKTNQFKTLESDSNTDSNSNYNNNNQYRNNQNNNGNFRGNCNGSGSCRY